MSSMLQTGYRRIEAEQQQANARRVACAAPADGMLDPDECADLAREWSMDGYPVAAFDCAVQSVRERGNWVLVNGRWHRRAGIMRQEHKKPLKTVCLCGEGIILQTFGERYCTSCGDQWC